MRTLGEYPERRRLYKKGLKDKEIGEEVGVTRAAIQQWRQRRGLSVNKEEKSLLDKIRDIF